MLATVKSRIEELAESRKEFPELITTAQHWLLAREACLTTGDDTPSARHVSFDAETDLCL